MGGKKKFTLRDLNKLVPLTYNQQKFKDIYNSGVEVIFQLGAAGAGKTSLALSEAFAEVLDPSTHYDKVIIIRSAVAVREIGYLPGSLDEKAQSYEAPYIDAVKSIFNYKEPYENLKAVGLLEFALTSYLRGVNFTEGSIIIVDECQNLDFEEINTAYTRLCKGSKIIFCGDGKQTDIQRLKKQDSGLAKFIDIFDNMHKYEDEFNDYSNMINEPYDQYEYKKDIPNYAIINYEDKDCLRNDKVRNYLITKHKMGL